MSWFGDALSSFASHFAGDDNTTKEGAKEEINKILDEVEAKSDKISTEMFTDLKKGVEENDEILNRLFPGEFPKGAESSGEGSPRPSRVVWKNPPTPN